MSKGLQVQPCVGPSGCCKSSGCNIASDTFDRADEDPVTGWTSLGAGIWEIESNVVKTSATFEVLQINTAHPAAASTGVVAALVKGSEGDQARVVIDLIAGDNDNYHYAQYTFPQAGERGCLVLGSRVGGTDTELTKTDVLGDPDEWHSLTLYYDGVTLAVDFNDGDATLCYDDLPIGGTRAGVAVGDVGSLGVSFVYFDNFTYRRIAEPETEFATCPEVPTCGCVLSDDEFDADPLCRYEQTGGAWFTALSEIHPPGASATLLLETTNENVNGAYKVSTRVKGASDDVVKILFDDGNIYAQLTFGTSKTLKLFDGGGELTSLTLSTAAATYIDFEACLANGVLKANANGNIIAWPTTMPTGGRAGIGTGGTAATVRFDRLTISRVENDDLDSVCGECELPCAICDTGVANPQITVEISGIESHGLCTCAELNGTFILDWIGSCNWRYTFSPAACNSRPFPIYFIDVNLSEVVPNEYLLSLRITGNGSGYVCNYGDNCINCDDFVLATPHFRLTKYDCDGHEVVRMSEDQNNRFMDNDTGSSPHECRFPVKAFGGHWEIEVTL